MGNIGVILTHFINSLNWSLYYKYNVTTPGIDCKTEKKHFGDNLEQMAYVEFQYNELNMFPEDGSYVFLNERITRTGALECLCKQKSSADKVFEIMLPY